MSRLDQRLQALREHTTPPLDEGDVERIIAGGVRRQRVRRVRRAAAATLMLMLAVGFTWRQLAVRPDLTFADGSTARLIDPASLLAVTESSSTRTVVAVRRGVARFDVTRNPARLFRVVAGTVSVEVVGTRFVVDRQAGEVRVGVERGKVRVHSPEGVFELAVGEARTFSSAPVTDPESAASPEPVEAPRPAPRVHEPSKPPAAKVHDVAGGLLQAADAARWGGHPADAVAPLERVIRDHRTDPRAQLAAFTLGRVLFEELHRPRDAARAFARARGLAPDGPLAEDALFHEIECLSRVGSLARAGERRREYLRLFPSGSHRHAVEQLGGSE